MSEENKGKMLRAFEEGWNNGKLEVFDEDCATDFVHHDPAQPADLNLEAYKQYITATRASFPDLHFTVEELIAEGDTVTARWAVRATHQGEFLGIPPTGKQAAVTGISISRYVGGKAVETWTNWDALGMMQQLGVIPPPGEGEG
jgi:steroid delta-isomerase-like uncharacterized protein